MANSTNKNAKTQAKQTTKAETKPDVPIVPKEVDPNQIIVVRNGFQGRLVYVSPRTHERFKWDAFGDEQEMELRELRNAKSSAKNFFIHNWFMFDEDNLWVIDFLGLKKYYKNAIRLEDFDKVFRQTPSEIEKIISALSDGQKKSVAYRARQLVLQGEIDSRKVIAVLEKSLGIELIER